jgi:hypothetical protein
MVKIIKYKMRLDDLVNKLLIIYFILKSDEEEKYI